MTKEGQIDWIRIFENIDITNELKVEAFLTNTLKQEEDYFSKASFNLTLQYLHKLKKEIIFLSDIRKLDYLKTLNIKPPAVGNSESHVFNQTVFEGQSNFFEFTQRYIMHLENYFTNHAALNIPEILKDKVDTELYKHELQLQNYLDTVPLEIEVDGKKLNPIFSINTTIKEVCDVLKGKSNLQDEYESKKRTSPDWKATLQKWVDGVEQSKHDERYKDSIYHIAFNDIADGKNSRLYMFTNKFVIYTSNKPKNQRGEKRVINYTEEFLVEISKAVAMAYKLPELKKELAEIDNLPTQQREVKGAKLVNSILVEKREELRLKGLERDKQAELERIKCHETCIDKEYNYSPTLEDFKEELAIIKLNKSTNEYLLFLRETKKIYKNANYYYIVWGARGIGIDRGELYTSILNLIQDEIDNKLENISNQQTETKINEDNKYIDCLKIKNNFDNIKIEDVYTHFKICLVEKKYLTENNLLFYLHTAFEQMAVPETLFRFNNAPTKGKIIKVFNEYYKNVAGKPHGKQKKYAALLGNYFEGYSTENVSSNFTK